MKSKFETFNWHAIEIDGHNHVQIKQALMEASQIKNKPTAIIAHTIKGKGVSFMENKLLWHYKSPDQAQWKQAIKEISEQ